MSNALSLLSKNAANLPAHLRAAQQSTDWDGIGGNSVPRIEVADRRIKAILNGTEIASSRDPIEVVLVRPGPVGRMYYQSDYVKGEKAKPDCYSNDGEHPAADAQRPQSTRCDTCPQNIKGSSKTMGDSKACRYRQNVAVWLPGEKTWDKLFRLSLPATAIFPDEENADGYRPLNRYVKELRAISATPSMVWTKIAIDDYKDQPRLLFKVVDWVEDAEEFAQVERLAKSPDMDGLLNMMNGSEDAHPAQSAPSPTAAALGPRPTTRRSRSTSYPMEWPAGVAETDFDDLNETYWYHESSDTYFAVPPGTLLPDEKVCEELTKDVFESDLQVQAEELRVAREKAEAAERAAREKAEREEAQRLAAETLRLQQEEEAEKRRQAEAAAAAGSSRRRRTPQAELEPEVQTRRRRETVSDPAPSSRRRGSPQPEEQPEETPAPTETIGRRRRNAEPAETVEPVESQAPAKTDEPAPEKPVLSSRRRQPVKQDDTPATPKPEASKKADDPVEPPARAAAADSESSSEAPNVRGNADLAALESIILNENPDD